MCNGEAILKGIRVIMMQNHIRVEVKDCHTNNGLHWQII